MTGILIEQQTFVIAGIPTKLTCDNLRTPLGVACEFVSGGPPNR